CGVGGIRSNSTGHCNRSALGAPTHQSDNLKLPSHAALSWKVLIQMSEPLRERTSGRAQALWLGWFLIFFLLLRVPAFLANWDGEDANGHCAAILLGWAAPNELIFSRIDGVSHFDVGF